MLQILTLIRFAFPFLLLTAFFCLYRKEYGFMKRFMWKMAMFQSARNLYAYLVVLMLIFINWCCHAVLSLEIEAFFLFCNYSHIWICRRVFITTIDACIIAECLYLFFVIIPITSESNGKNSNITNGMNKAGSGKFNPKRKK